MADSLSSTFHACSKCGTEKPFTVEFFRPKKKQCRECERGYQRAYNKTRNPEKIRLWLRDSRRKNPEKHQAWDRAKYLKRIDAVREYTRKRYAYLDKKKAAEDVKKWKAANPERVKQMWRRTYEKNKTKHTERALRWARENKEAIAAIRMRRRAREFSAEGSFTRDEVKRLLKDSERRCFYCSSFVTKFHIDHFIPLSRGGTNDITNIRISCPECNLSKSHKMPWDWKPEKFAKLD